MADGVIFTANASAGPMSGATRSTTVLLQGSDRGAAPTAGAYAGVRVASLDGASQRYAYISYRHLWPTAGGSLFVHEVRRGG